MSTEEFLIFLVVLLGILLAATLPFSGRGRPTSRHAPRAPVGDPDSGGEAPGLLNRS